MGHIDSLITSWFLFFSLQWRLSSLLAQSFFPSADRNEHHVVQSHTRALDLQGGQLPGHIHEKQSPLWSEDSDGSWVTCLAESFLPFGLRRRVGVLVRVTLSPTHSPNPAGWSYTSRVETSALNIGLAMSSRRTWRSCWIIDMYVLKSASV